MRKRTGRIIALFCSMIFAVNPSWAAGAEGMTPPDQDPANNVWAGDSSQGSDPGAMQQTESSWDASAGQGYASDYSSQSDGGGETYQDYGGWQDNSQTESYAAEETEYTSEETQGTVTRNSDSRITVDEAEIYSTEDAESDFTLLSYLEIPSSYYLDVPEILQKPELPTGCESVSLTMALKYYGFDVDKTTLASDFLIYNNESDNMALGYVGDPFSESGAGCFPPALAATAAFFFEDQGADYAAYNLTGSTLSELLTYVAADTPVLVWTTMYMAEPDFTRNDSEYDGQVYRWYSQEHCVVLSGYDLSAGTLQINDPLEGIVTRDMDAFESIYNKTGQMAVVLKEKETVETQETEAQSGSSTGAEVGLE